MFNLCRLKLFALNSELLVALAASKKCDKSQQSSLTLAAEQAKNVYCCGVHAHAIENTAAAEQSERKERTAERSERDDEKRAHKSDDSQRRRLAAR